MKTRNASLRSFVIAYTSTNRSAATFTYEETAKGLGVESAGAAYDISVSIAV